MANRKHPIPAKRRDELVECFQRHAGDLSLEYVAEMKPPRDERPFRSHGQIAVECLVRRDGIEAVVDFVRGWRRLFLKTLDPQYLSPLWDVNMPLQPGMDDSTFL